MYIYIDILNYIKDKIIINIYIYILSWSYIHLILSMYLKKKWMNNDKVWLYNFLKL